MSWWVFELQSDGHSWKQFCFKLYHVKIHHSQNSLFLFELSCVTRNTTLTVSKSGWLNLQPLMVLHLWSCVWIVLWIWRTVSNWICSCIMVEQLHCDLIRTNVYGCSCEDWLNSFPNIDCVYFFKFINLLLVLLGIFVYTFIIGSLQINHFRLLITVRCKWAELSFLWSSSWYGTFGSATYS